MKEQPAPLTKSIEQPAQKSWLGQISDKVQGVVDWGKVKFAKGMAKINKTSPFDTVDPHAAARLNRKELGIKERANLTKGIEGKTTKIDRLKGLLESGRSSSGNFLTDANKHNIRRNITKAEESRAKMQDRLGPSTEAQKKKAEEAAAKETLAAQQKRQGQPSEEPWPTTSGEAKARWDKKQPVKTSVRTATAGAGGGAFAEVERIMEGTTFISSLDGAFVKGADYAAQQLKEAFKSLDSTTIELKTTLGAPIQVHLIAGEGVKKLQVDLDKLKSRLDNELNKGINADGSNPDPSMDSNSAARGS